MAYSKLLPGKPMRDRAKANKGIGQTNVSVAVSRKEGLSYTKDAGWQKFSIMAQKGSRNKEKKLVA
jgi:hypothetical protein